MKKLSSILAAIALSLQLLNASCINDGLIWSEIIFTNYCSAIFTGKVLDNIAIEEEEEEFGKIYNRKVGYRIVVQVEKVFFGKVDTGVVNITNRYAMESEKTYLIYANHGNPQGNYFYLADDCVRRIISKKITNEKDVIRELKILSELSNIP